MSGGINAGIDSQGFVRVADVDARRRTQTADRDLRDDVVELLRDILAELRMLRTGAVLTDLVQNVASDEVI